MKIYFKNVAVVNTVTRHKWRESWTICFTWLQWWWDLPFFKSFVLLFYHWPGYILNGTFIQLITSQKEGSSTAVPPSTLPSYPLIGCQWDSKSALAVVGQRSQPMRKEQLLHSCSPPAGLLLLLLPLSQDLDLRLQWCAVSQWGHNVTWALQY